MISISSWVWSLARYKGITKADRITLPLSMTAISATQMAEMTLKLVVIAQAVEASLDPKPALPRPLIMENDKPDPFAHLSWDKGRQQMIITPAITVDLTEAKRIHKQLGQIIELAEGK